MKNEGDTVQNNLSFHIPTYSDDNSSHPKPVNDNYDYWVPLLNYFLAKSDTVEFHCWNEEVEIIEEIKSFQNGKIEVVKEENLTIFKGNNIFIFSDYLINHYNININKDRKFKWFTVNLNKGVESVFHSGHWGTEFFVPGVNEKDITFIKSVTPSKTIFHKI